MAWARRLATIAVYVALYAGTSVVFGILLSVISLALIELAGLSLSEHIRFDLFAIPFVVVVLLYLSRFAVSDINRDLRRGPQRPAGEESAKPVASEGRDIPSMKSSPSSPTKAALQRRESEVNAKVTQV